MRIAEGKPASTQLEVRDLQLVLTLAATGSTAAASNALHLTQSAVSRALGQVEERLGVTLFDRHARGLTPTAAGERLLGGALPVLQQLSELERAVTAPAAEPISLRLVCECYTAYRWLPSAMASLQASWAGLSVDVAAEHTADPATALARGDVDVALLTTSLLPKAHGLCEQPLFSDEVVLVLSAGHALAGRRSLTPRDLAGEPLITGHAPSAEKQWFLRSVFGRRKPKLSFLRFPLTEAVIDAARAGMGVAVLSEWIASGYLDRAPRDLVVKRLASGPLRRPWRLAYRPEMTHVAERLKATLQSSAPRLRFAG